MSGLMQKISLMPWRASLTELTPGASYDPAQAATILQNFIPTLEGTTKLRNGYRAWKTNQVGQNVGVPDDASAVAACFAGKFSGVGGGEFLIYAFDEPSTSRQTLFIEGEHFRAQTPTAGPSGVFGTLPDFSVVHSRLYITRPGERPLSFHPLTGFVVESDMPIAHYVLFFKGRLIMGRMEGGEGRIQWSQPGTLSFRGEGSGFIQVAAQPGDYVTGMHVYMGQVIVTTRRGIFRFDFTPDVLGFSLQQISTTTGCIANRSMTQVGNDLFFLSEHGVHSLQRTQAYGDLDKTLVSASLGSLFRQLSPETLYRSSAVFDERKGLYMLSLPVPRAVAARVGIDTTRYNPSPGASGLFYMTLVYELSDRWATWDFPAQQFTLVESLRGPLRGSFPACGAIWYGSSGTEVTIGGFQMNNTFDMTRNIHGLSSTHSQFTAGRQFYKGILRTPPLTAGEPGQLKDWRRVDIFFRSGSAGYGKLRWLIDGNYSDDLRLLEWYREFNESDFYLSPNQRSGGPWISASGNGLVLGTAGQFLDGTEWALERETVEIPGHGRTLILELEVESREFEFFGFDVYFLPGTSDIISEASSNDETYITRDLES